MKRKKDQERKKKSVEKLYNLMFFIYQNKVKKGQQTYNEFYQYNGRNVMIMSKYGVH